jgi:hypothetical protein
MTATVQERVATGAKALDVIEPGWEAKINLVTLNLNSPDHCVLGQLYGNYYAAPEALRSFARRRLGFWAVSDDGTEEAWENGKIGEEYRELTAAWRNLILARRGEAINDDEVIDRFQRELDMERASHVLVAL